MRKLRVGVWLNDDIMPEHGGGYGYYTQLINKFNSFEFKDAEIIFLNNTPLSRNPVYGNYYKIIWQPLPYNKMLNFLAKLSIISSLFPSLKKRLLNINKEHQKKLDKELNAVVDIIYYVVPDCVFPDFPYIYTLWDLGHLTMYAFPEVSMNGIFESRKKHIDNYLHKALLIFTESEAGKSDAIKYLNINENRIKVVPTFPSGIIHEDVLAQKPAKLEDGLFFIHYPAQYWVHKNHYNLLLAFKNVLQEFPTLRLIFTGSDKGNKEYIFKMIDELGLKDKIIDLGFIPEEELKWVYLNSLGLVMPTFLGPTNMPLIEAAKLGCPVACSNIAGHKEQLSSYGYYFNPSDPSEMSDCIIRMITDRKNGIRREYIDSFNITNTIRSIDSAFSELKHIRLCWGDK
ncbi:MAG: hypothetical protein JWN78_2679 [Bacteroidota bacterium]|nr:hypothetical protein [Bacteroidota bacterium]